MISCSKTNIYLKRIAAECGIDKRVTFHAGRHCYASVVALSQGVPLETVAELLGQLTDRINRYYKQILNEQGYYGKYEMCVRDMVLMVVDFLIKANVRLYGIGNYAYPHFRKEEKKYEPPTIQK
jgi:hypothetical protein